MKMRVSGSAQSSVVEVSLVKIVSFWEVDGQIKGPVYIPNLSCKIFFSQGNVFEGQEVGFKHFLHCSVGLLVMRK